MTNTKSLAVLALAFTIFTWGVAPALVRAFSLTAGPADALVIRMVATAFCGLPLFFITGWRVEQKDLPLFFLVSMIGNFGYFFGTIFGYTFVPAGFGSMIIAIQPLLIALLAAAIGREKLRAAAVVGMVISFAGTIYLFTGDNSGTTTTANLVKGGLLILLCDMGWAIYVIYSFPLVKKYGTFKFTAWTVVLTAVPALAFASHTTLAALQNLDSGSWFSLAFLSIIATVICLVTWNFATRYLTPTTMGASLYLIPVLAVASGWIMLGERLSFATLTAGAIILAGVAVAEFGKSLKSRAGES